MKLNTKKIALCGILTALSLIAFVLENLFPPIIFPGAKMGLSNVFILLTAIFCGGLYAFIALIIKCVLGSIFSGNVSAVLYSLPAGVIALSVELLILYFVKRTSIVSASVAGAVINITLQNLTFCLITNSFEYIVYLPYLSLIGVLAGLVVGFAVYLAIRFLKLNFFLEGDKREKTDDD